MSSIFRAYDVRGIYPEEINKEEAYKIGFAAAKFLQSKNPNKKLTIVIGEDCRIASPALRGAVVDAVNKAGVNVFYISACTTPLFYFSVNTLKADGGIMVTASHNPPQYGGLKIVGPESAPIGEETGLKEIEMLSEGELAPVKEHGSIEEKNLISDYANFVIKESNAGLSDGMFKLVVDAGNGMTPLVLEPIFEKLNLKYTPLYFEIDCNFPNHSPDITRTDALDELKKKVLDTGAHLGVAFDGDGDRVMFIDEKGELVRPDNILALLYKNSRSGLFHKTKAVYDIRFSRAVKEILGASGIRSRPGHAFIKKVMRDNKADLGGELSGHFFFKEMQYAESSVLVMLKVMKIVSDSRQPISQLVKPFQKGYHSGEINMPILSREAGLGIIEKLKETYKDGRIDLLDGITVEYDDWWFNLRLSNTEPIVRLVVEADTEEMMKNKTEEIKKAL